MLNQPRTIPYQFRVFQVDDIAWLTDMSEVTYPCTATPHLYCEALYTLSDSDDYYLPDPSLFLERDVASRALHEVTLHTDDELPETDSKTAWDAAREAANQNHLV